MKKIGLFVLFAGVLLVTVTGCGKKETKLVCNQESSGVDVIFNVEFTNNVIEDMDFSYNMDLSSYNDTQIKAIEKQDFCTIVKSYLSSYKNAFEDCKQSVKEKQLKVSADLDVDKLTANAIDKKSTPEEAKKALEKEGYTCKIK